MADPLVYVDVSRIQEGKLKELEQALSELAAFVEENVPDAIAYRTYLDREEGRMTVIQVHPGSASLEHHMEVSGELFGRFRDLVELERIDVYGEPSPELVETLEAKADMLGAGSVGVHEAHAGFERYSPA